MTKQNQRQNEHGSLITARTTAEMLIGQLEFPFSEPICSRTTDGFAAKYETPRGSRLIVEVPSDYTQLEGVCEYQLRLTGENIPASDINSLVRVLSYVASTLVGARADERIERSKGVSDVFLSARYLFGHERRICTFVDKYLSLALSLERAYFENISGAKTL